MTGKRFEWRLLEMMTEQGIHNNAELRRRLMTDGVDLSTSQVHRLVTETPDRLNLVVLASLCRILDVSPADLIDVNHEPEQAANPAADGTNIVDLASQARPKRARITYD